MKYKIGGIYQSENTKQADLLFRPPPHFLPSSSSFPFFHISMGNLLQLFKLLEISILTIVLQNQLFPEGISLPNHCSNYLRHIHCANSTRAKNDAKCGKCPQIYWMTSFPLPFKLKCFRHSPWVAMIGMQWRRE